MSSTATEVWIAAQNGQDIIRADAIVVVRLDAGGRLTAQLRDESRVTVTLLEGMAPDGPPGDFHRQLIRAVVQLADSSGAKLLTARQGPDGWAWVTEPM